MVLLGHIFCGGKIALRIDFNILRTIIRDKKNKTKKSTDSAVCLSEFINLNENIIDMHRNLMQDESANFILSMQNWITRRTYTTCYDTIDIGDIFYADLGINYMPEFSYHHPVIILEKVGSMVLVVPVSTSEDNINNAYHPTDNPTGDIKMRKVYGNDKGAQSDGFEKTCAVLLTDIKTISKGRLIKKKGSMSDINNADSVFKEIKQKTFKMCFPKENIALYNTKQQLEKMKEENQKLQDRIKYLEDEYNKLRDSKDE